MKRLLCITANMNAGGAETFLMKIYRELDRTQFQMDFCVNSNKNKYAEEIASLGGNIYCSIKIEITIKSVFGSKEYSKRE